MKKYLIYLIILLNGIFLLLLSEYIFYKPDIVNIRETPHLNKKNEKKIVVSMSKKGPQKFQCSINNGKLVKAINNKCILYAKNGKNKILVKNYMSFSLKKINVKADYVDSISLNHKEYYLAVGENLKLEGKINKIGKPKYKEKWFSTNEEIAKVNEKGEINAITPGTVEIGLEVQNEKKIMKLIVTDLIMPRTLDMSKQVIPCNIYSNEDNELLDKILESRIKEKGEGTRAALIEAIRFLPLSLKYKIPYFFENGRLNPYGNQHYVDGEGRYYKKGLYLSENKKNDIKKSFAGPSIWGCPLTNYDTSYGWVFGGKYPNGLDCSGFVTWALYNSGQDIGDIGSGITNNVDDVSDLGEIHELTYEYANSNDYKVGDIIARDGHTALIAGKDEENIYIAESLLKGVVIETFSYKDKNSKLYKLYGYIGKLDNIYKSDGEYDNMW